MPNQNQNPNQKPPNPNPKAVNPNTPLPAIEPQVKQQVSRNQAAMTSSFELAKKDSKKLPDDPWLHRILIIIPIVLLISIVALSWAFFIRGRNVDIPFISPKNIGPLQNYLASLETSADKNTTDEQKEETLRTYVESRAEVSDTLTLTNCQPDPLVLEVADGESFTVVNNDADIHTLNIGKHYAIPAKGETEIVAIFNLDPEPPAAYYYTCDDSPNTAGYILVR